MSASDSDLNVLAEAIATLDDRLLLVVTGAGVSLASGIATFRGTDPDAVWSRDVTELGTFRYFRRDPAGSWHWYLQRFDQTLKAHPNPAHSALVALEGWHTQRGGDFLLVTQNVDTLHRRAGSQRLVEVHGSADRVRCSRVGCTNGAPSGSLPRAELDMAAFLADPRRETVPCCPLCGALLRQHVLWFDEFYTEHDDYQFERVVTSARRAELAIFVGTSFSVGVTELTVSALLDRGRPVFSIDPSGARPRPGIQTISLPAEAALPALYQLVQAS